MKPLTKMESVKIAESERQRMYAVIGGVTVVANMRKGADVTLIKWAKRNGIFVRIDRKTPMGNPFYKLAREESIKAFEKYFKEKVEDPVGGCCGGSPQPVVAAVLTINKPSVLGCWCYPSPCHGDFIAKMVNQPDTFQLKDIFQLKEKAPCQLTLF